jgi:hypothetical protein
LGALAGPGGEFVGGIAGAVGGAKGGGSLYDGLFGKKTPLWKRKLAQAGANALPGIGPLLSIASSIQDLSRTNPANKSTKARPTVLDDAMVNRLRADAKLGDKEALAQLKKIQDSLDRQTAILASQQRQVVTAAASTTTAVKNSRGGYGN